VGLVIAAAGADGAGLHGLAFYALLLAVPAAAVAALEAFGRVLDGANEHLHALLWTIVLGLVLVGSAARAPAVAEDAVPAAARSALLACLAVFCVQAVVAATEELRSR
jgi:uncharacterized membrane protein